jgi:hypothetical protein
MVPPLDLFSIQDNEPMWLGASESLAHATEMARQKGPGLYFVFSHQTGHKTMYRVDENGVIQAMDDPVDRVLRAFNG